MRQALLCAALSLFTASTAQAATITPTVTATPGTLYETVIAGRFFKGPTGIASICSSSSEARHCSSFFDLSLTKYRSKWCLEAYGSIKI
jgi:hypothetical protein